MVTINVVMREKGDLYNLFGDMKDYGVGAIVTNDGNGKSVALPKEIEKALLKWAGYDEEE